MRPRYGPRLSVQKSTRLAPSSWFVLGALLILATVLQLARQAGVPAWDSIWAEDGAVFLTDALNNDLSILVEPYAGYVHLAPRALAELATMLPIAYAAWIMSVIPALIVSGLGAYVFVAARRVIPPVWLRGCLVALFVLLPLAGSEATANVANLHWFLTFSAFWALWPEPRTRRLEIVGACICLLAAASDPLVGMLLPVAALRVINARRLDVVSTGLLVGLVIQLVAIVSSGIPSEPSSVGLIDLPYLFSIRVAASLPFGDSPLRWLWESSEAIVWAGAFLVYAFLGWFTVNRWGRHALLPLAAFVISLALVAAPLITRDLESLFPTDRGLGSGANRYLIVPILLLYSAAAWCLKDTKFTRSTQMLGIAVVALLIVIDLRVDNARSEGPRWSSEVATARCEGERMTELAVAPRPWAVQIECSRL